MTEWEPALLSVQRPAAAGRRRRTSDLYLWLIVSRVRYIMRVRDF